MLGAMFTYLKFIQSANMWKHGDSSLKRSMPSIAEKNGLLCALMM